MKKLMVIGLVSFSIIATASTVSAMGNENREGKQLNVNRQEQVQIQEKVHQGENQECTGVPFLTEEERAEQRTARMTERLDQMKAAGNITEEEYEKAIDHIEASAGQRGAGLRMGQLRNNR